MKSFRSIFVFCLLIFGIHTVSAQGPYHYWPTYTKTKISDISQAPWIETDHIVDDWDWSLPDKLTPAATSKLITQRNIYLTDQRIKNFPSMNGVSFGNPVVTHWLNWKDLEPSEDTYNWDGVRYVLDLCKAKGYKSVIRIMTCRVERSAPSWFANEGISKITHSNGEVDYDPEDPKFHQFYKDLVASFGATGIQNRDDVVGLYVGWSSKSWGDEHIGPVGTIVQERLDAWAAITNGIEHKMGMGGESDYGFGLGFGTRRGFVEHYMYHIPDDVIGQKLDANNYLYIDEDNPLIANNVYHGEENEEYDEKWVDDGRFGNSIAAYPYRYFSSNIRLLQMRCNAVLYNDFSLMPEMLAWVGQELARTRQDAPDVFCFLRETELKSGQVKNFERWLYQRDTPGYETQAVLPIDKNYDSWMYVEENGKDKNDYIARKGAKIGFAADDVVFPTGVTHNVAIKISYHDNVAGTLKLVYTDGNGNTQERTITANGTDAIKTATFFVTAKFDATGFNYDFELQCEAGKEVPVSFVRVIKNEPLPTVGATGVTITPTTLALQVGRTGQMTKTVQPTNASNQIVSWSSSNNSVASVNSNGMVTGVSLGNATITATTNDGGFIDICEVNVVPRQTQNLIINGDFSISDPNDPDYAWSFLLNSNTGADAAFNVVSGKGQIDITTSGSSDAQMKLRQYVDFIAGHNYTITFKFSGTVETQDGIRYFHKASNEDRAIGPRMDVTTGEQAYSYSWDQTISENIEINLQMGMCSGTVTIDDVELIDNGILSVDETALKLINLYPNPVSDKLHVEFSKIDKNHEIIIFDSRGQIIHKDLVKIKHKQIDIASLNANGILFVKIILGNQYKVYKIIVP